MKFNKFHLKNKYRKVLENLSDEDKIKTLFKKTSDVEIINKVLIYYELKNHPLHKKLALEKLNKIKNVEFAYLYAKVVIGGRWPEAEPFFIQENEYCYLYAFYILKSRWPEAEQYLKEDYLFAFLYARDVIQGRWPEAENAIKNDEYYAYRYSLEILNRRWHEAEHIIKGDPYWAYHYAKDVIKGRWPEAESLILISTLKNNYKTLFNLHG